ncbi:MAG TPA: carboxypeptidase regulatory-like domain-containing protein [Pyrinomonadaceae bacterium]
MKTKAILCLLLLIWSGRTVTSGKTIARGVSSGGHVVNNSGAISVEDVFNLTDFGAVGDGVTDDGPALQNALDAMAEAGGGTLFVPAGRYAIITPVQKNFSGLASDISIFGVESLTPVPPANSSADELTRGLDLLSEFAPRTGEQGISISISGLQSFLIKDITFIGTPGVNTDALITLSVYDVWEATIRHCEFYGLSSLVAGGAIVQAVRSRLMVEQTAFLGSTCSSGLYSSVVQNLEWKGISIAETIFVDYGRRAELYGKLDTAPFSWVNIGNAAVLTSDSPRREASISNVFLDEGGFVDLSSLPDRYQPASAPIDLVYVTGLYMNVSNLGTTGHYLDGLRNVLIEDSHYGWSHNTDSAIHLLSVVNAILDQVECAASADRIRADSATGNLTVIDSVYNHLDSLAQTTSVITTNSRDEDPVQYVRQQFTATLGRDPDPAAHFYWSDQILQCGENSQCVSAKRAALDDYLAAAPAEKFAVSGKIVDENGTGMAGVTVALSGSQNVTTETDTGGRYQFSNLPTSGVYSVIPSRRHYTLNPVSYEISTPAADQTFNSTAIFNHHTIGGRVADGADNALADITVTLSGSRSMTATTGANGEYLFKDLPAGGNYTVTPRKPSYAFSPATSTLNDLDADQSQDFAGTFVTYTIAGILVGANNNPLPGATITLSGSESRTTTTNGVGEFSFSGIPSEGNYTVTPTLIGYSFTPSSKTFNALAENQYHAYVGTHTTHSISGRVTHSSGIALSGALVSLSGFTSAATTTDADGNYNFSGLPRGGDYTLTVSKTNYTFIQPSRTFNNLTSNQTADFDSTLNVHSISGRVTVGQTSLSGVIVTLSGSQSGTATTDANGIYSFDLSAGGSYTVAPAKTNYLFSPSSMTFSNLSGNQSADFGATLQRVLEFSAASYSVSEGTRTISVTVSRSGDTSGAAEVIYSATDGSAQQRSDVIPVIGRLSFEPNETSKTFIIFITDDAYVEGDENLTLELSDVVGGFLGTNSTAKLTITDNDSGPASANPIDGAHFFVRQQYRDFLNRAADTEGLAFWTDQILNCGTDAACISDRRTNVSAAFFLSIEFQETGFLVYRLYRASFAQPPEHLDEFLLDTRTIGEGVVVNAPGWQALLEANKTAFIEDFVARSEFSQAYPLSLTPAEFVNLLNSKTGGALSPNDVAAAIAEFNGAATSNEPQARARVLRRVAENLTFSQHQLNPAFVLMQYFGYLQRNPNDAPDTNLDGYNFWLHKLEEFNGDFRRAEMVKSFLISSEYRARFGDP